MGLIWLISPFIYSTILLPSEFFLVLISFSSDDPSWGFRSNKSPINFYGIYGAWLAGFVIRELGILPGCLTSLVLFIWSLKLFYRSNFNFLKLKLLTFLLMIFLNALGSTYFEGLLYENLLFQSSIINNDYEDDKKHNFILIDDRQKKIKFRSN